MAASVYVNVLALCVHLAMRIAIASLFDACTHVDSEGHGRKHAVGSSTYCEIT